jgi:hypothetical protein
MGGDKVPKLHYLRGDELTLHRVCARRVQTPDCELISAESGCCSSCGFVTECIDHDTVAYGQNQPNISVVLPQ